MLSWIFEIAKKTESIKEEQEAAPQSAAPAVFATETEAGAAKNTSAAVTSPCSPR